MTLEENIMGFGIAVEIPERPYTRIVEYSDSEAEVDGLLKREYKGRGIKMFLLAYETVISGPSSIWCVDGK